MSQAVQKQVLVAEPGGESASWTRVKRHFGRVYDGVLSTLEVLGAARRVGAALELRRMPSMDDLAVLGIQDATSIRNYIGRFGR